MIAIQPYKSTDDGAMATAINVLADNVTDVSVDAVWWLYDAVGAYVNNGRIQLAGDDFAAWQTNDKYVEQYVITQKGLTVIN